MKYLSIFSGVDAASLAFLPLGWECIGLCEVDPFPSAILAHRYPDCENLGDIRQVDWSDFVKRRGRPDVLIGGSPCTSFSIAGGRESLDGESRLMFEYIRAVQDLRPGAIIWENVPGVLSTRDNAFGQLLQALVDIGYRDLAYRVFDSQFFALAQRRRRVFLVGHLAESGFRSAAVLSLADSSARDTTKVSEKREELAAKARAGASQADGDGCLTHWDVQSRRVFTEQDTWPALYAGDGEGHGYVAQDDPIAFAQNQRDEVRLIGGDGTISSSLNAQRWGTHKNETLIAEPIVMASGQSNAEIGVGGVAPTIAARNYKDPPVLFN